MKVEELKKYKTSLYTSLSNNLEAFEKNFVLLSTGMLAFSITFIKDIVKIDEATYLFVLFIGWFFILLAIGLMMYAFLSSVAGSNKLWKLVDDYIVEKQKFDSNEELSNIEALNIKKDTNTELYRIKRRLKNMRITAVSSFLLGVFLFSIFVSLNLYRENIKSNSLEILNAKNKGSIIKTGGIEVITNDSVVIIRH